MTEPNERAILFYDGVCGLCDHAVQFVLRHDAREKIQLAPLQSHFAREALTRFGHDPDVLDTVFLLRTFADGSEKLFERSDAAVETLRLIGSSKSATALQLVPRPLRNLAYDFVAKRRYRWFGKHDSCPLPPPELTRRFAARSLE